MVGAFFIFQRILLCHKRIGSYTRADRKSYYNKLNGINSRQGGKSVIGILSDKKAVDYIVHCLYQLSQHYRRSDTEHYLPHAFCSEKFRRNGSCFFCQKITFFS